MKKATTENKKMDERFINVYNNKVDIVFELCVNEETGDVEYYNNQFDILSKYNLNSVYLNSNDLVNDANKSGLKFFAYEQ